MSGLSVLGLLLARAAPGLIALLAKRCTRDAPNLVNSAAWLGCFALLILSVASIARYGVKLTWAEVGFAAMSSGSIPSGIVLALFFILVYGPVVHWMLERTGLGSFDAAQRSLARLPGWYLCLTILIVAADEEWLYRGYAIERLRFADCAEAAVGPSPSTAPIDAWGPREVAKRTCPM